MRQIKFRVWDKKWKRWILPGDINYFGDIWGWEFDRRAEPDGDVIETVKHSSGETVLEQFTGLHDKNGVEVYEGSVIQECVVGQVIWDGDGVVEECPCGEVIIGTIFTDIGRKKTGKVRLLKSGNLGKKGERVDLHMTTYDGLYQWPDGILVIGNIHSNPKGTT